MQLPKHMLVIKNGQIIVRGIEKFVTSEPHLDDGRPGPLRAIPFLEKGESMIYDSEDKVHIIGGWDDRKIFIDGKKS